MRVHQLSIFIENKSGTLRQILNILKEKNIQLIATTISDTIDYGIYRVICSEPERAYKELQKIGILVNLTEVFAIILDNKIGEAADTLSLFSDANIDISYLYSFLLNGKGILVFKTDDSNIVETIIKENHLSCIEEKDLIHLN